MSKINQKFNDITVFFEKNANPVIEKKYARFFTEGYDAYGIDKDIYHAQRDKWGEEWKKEMTMEEFLLLGDLLIATGKYELGGLAIYFASLFIDNFNNDLFNRMGQWLENNIKNWAHTDILSGLVLGPLVKNNALDTEIFKPWINSETVWKRRAVPVTLVELVKTDISTQKMFDLIESLMEDREKKVQQGLGWFLREKWKIEPSSTEKFLLKWKETCGRTIIQYATEKMPKETRLIY